MSHWKTKAHELVTAQAQLVAALAREADTPTLTKPVRGATPAGDELRLRGIPMQARGVGGTMRGTQPHSALR
jgi:hypothetical protein